MCIPVAALLRLIRGRCCFTCRTVRTFIIIIILSGLSHTARALHTRCRKLCLVCLRVCVMWLGGLREPELNHSVNDRATINLPHKHHQEYCTERMLRKIQSACGVEEHRGNFTQLTRTPTNMVLMSTHTHTYVEVSFGRVICVLNGYLFTA